MLLDIKNKLGQRLQNTFGIDIPYLYTGTKWNLVFQILASGSTFLAGLAFANWVNPEVYAQYKYVFTVAALLSSFAPLGLAMSVMKYTTQGADNSLSFGFNKNIIWSIPFTLISLATAGYYFIHGNQTLGFGIGLIGISYPLINGLTFFASFLNGQQKFRESSLYAGSINAGVSVALILWLLLVKDTRFVDYPLLLIIVSLSATILLNAGAYVYIKKFVTKFQEFNAKEFVSYGLHQSALSFLGVVASQIDKILVFQIIGGMPLAQYLFAIAIPEQIRSVFKGFSRLIFTRFEKRSLESIKKGMLKYILLALGATIAVGALYALAAPYIFSLFFKQYIDAVKFSQVFALSLCTIASILPQTALQVKGYNKQLYIFTVSSNTIQIGLNILCISIWGLWGAVYSQLIGRTLSFFIVTILFYWSKAETFTDSPELAEENSN
ncbi:MAG: oligosaccharide flippase family protein [Candidatus Zambryskibacteria bacterium]|nr:oligosaccharide flippase family protein [Candidatus Zambryskibacteria bacterium]